ncbi:MAG: aldehyde dehydrogenase family protein, partial [Oligoflexus sp.]
MGYDLQDIAKNYIRRAREAQTCLGRMTQREVDRVAFHCGKAVFDNAAILAEQAVKETGLGNVRDKTIKKRAKAEATWAEIKDRKTVGMIKRDDEKRMMYYADPVGIVAGVAPCTNPIATAMFYTMICMKTRNALIISPHPKAVESTKLTVKLMREAIAFANLPEHAIQILDEPHFSSRESLELSSLVMSLANMIVATGGPKLVDAAYHSGTPAYGVGAGNTPVYIHPSADIPAAVEKILLGRSFDNGIICASEQHLIVPREVYTKVYNSLSESGAYIVSDHAERQQLSRTIFDSEGHIKIPFLGKSASYIAEEAGLEAARDCRVLVVPVRVQDIGCDPYSAEKLCPILSMFT